jgi:branched-chain amino acid transport system permease protein
LNLRLRIIRQRALKTAALTGERRVVVTFLQELVNSLSVASVIILMGIGVTLIFGLTGIINFAHGEFLMLGAIGVWVLMGYGLGYIPAVLIAVAIVGLIGFLLERGLFQFTLTRPNNGFMASLGLSILLQHVVIRIWNSFSKSIPEPLPGVWQVGEIRFIKMRVVVVLVTAVVVAVTFLTISRSRYGLALRASLADRQTAALMGIPIRRYITVVFTYGSAIAGLGGALTIALFPVTPFVGSEMIMLGFAVALIAGLGNVPGVVGAGLILGLVTGFSGAYGTPEWTNAYTFGLMIVILIFRPQGLFGGTMGPAIE